MDWERFEFAYRIKTNDLFRLLVTIEAYRGAALNLVLPPDWREQLDRLNRVRAIRGTTALEGNPLSEQQVAEFLHNGDTGHRRTREQIQIENAGRAQDWVRSRFEKDQMPLRLHDLQKMHRLMTRRSDETNNAPGRFRTGHVVVGTPALGGVHRGAPPADVPRLMDDFVTFVNSARLRQEHPVIRALLGHFFLVTIHPFGDGNGRVSRLVEAAILYEGGYNVLGFYGLSNYFYRNRDEYMKRLQECRRTQPFNVMSFVKFGLDGFEAELGGINNFIKTKLNRVVYRSTMQKAARQKTGKRRRVLNDREYELLDFLLRETEPEDPFAEKPSRQILFSELVESPFVRAAYRTVTRRTFWRELARLADIGFIVFRLPEGSDQPIVEIDFGAIGRY